MSRRRPENGRSGGTTTTTSRATPPTGSATTTGRAPRPSTWSYYRDLRNRLETAGVPVVDAPIDLGEFEDWLDRYALLGRFYRRFGEMRIEKCLEHFIVARELRLRRGDTYVDVASAGSPWARVLRRRGVEAYRLDLIYRPGVRGINIGGDATATGLPAGFARAVSIQCAFELFFGETDRQFLEETARVLAPGGRAAITPLYLDDAHFVLHSPVALPPPGSEEPDAVRVWRDDEFRAPYSRHYSPEAFADRIASQSAAGALGARGLRVEPGRGHGGLLGPADLLVLHVRAREGPGLTGRLSAPALERDRPRLGSRAGRHEPALCEDPARRPEGRVGVRDDPLDLRVREPERQDRGNSLGGVPAPLVLVEDGVPERDPVGLLPDRAPRSRPGPVRRRPIRTQ